MKLWWKINILGNADEQRRHRPEDGVRVSQFEMQAENGTLLKPPVFYNFHVRCLVLRGPKSWKGYRAISFRVTLTALYTLF